MPGPPSATFKGTSEVGFCEEEENNGTLISECDNPLYQKTPNDASSHEYTVAKVIPGPNCKPNPDYTQEFFYKNVTDTVNLTLRSKPFIWAQLSKTRQANQNDAEPCDCHNYNIRLAINQGSEEPTQKQSKTVAKNLGFKSDMITIPGSPCSFRSASFAWDHLGDNDMGDPTILAMQGNPQGRVRDMKFDPSGVQFRDSSKITDKEACNPVTAPTCGNTTKVPLALEQQCDCCSHFRRSRSTS